MKSLKVFLSIFVITILFLCGCNKDEVKRNNIDYKKHQTFEDSYKLPTVDPQNKEEAIQIFYPMFEAFMITQYEYLLGNTDVPYWERFFVNRYDAIILKEKLDKHLANLKKYDIKYLSYTTKFMENEWASDETYQTSITFEKGKWYFKYLAEWYSLLSNDGSNEEAGILYDIVISKTGSTWKIERFEVSDNARIRWPELSLSVERSINSDEDSGKNVNTVYGRISARNYAWQHYNSPNLTSWCDYTNNGGDCTNFVSQCLNAGGWYFLNNGSYCSTGSWYHNGAGYCWNTSTVKNYSCSWTQAADLQSFLLNSSRVAPACYSPSSLSEGDIVQLVNSYGIAYHSMLVTIPGTNPRVTYRNGGSFPPGKDVYLSSFTSSQVYWKLNNSFWYLKV